MMGSVSPSRENFVITPPPAISKDQLDIIQKYDLTLPSSALTAYGLATRINAISARLEAAQSEPLSNKLKALFASAFALAVLAAGVFGLITGNAAGWNSGLMMLLFFGTLLSHVGLGSFYASKWSVDKRPELPEDNISCSMALFGAPLLPLWAAFGKIPRYKSALETDQPEYERVSAELTAFFTQNKAKCDEVISKLGQEIQSINSQINGIYGVLFNEVFINTKQQLADQRIYLELAQRSLKLIQEHFTTVSVDEKKSD